jgi:surfeit locus 1 family protein
MRSKSLFWPTVFAIGGVIVLLGLGTWQVQRLWWKEGLLAALAAPPTELPATLDAARALEYHRVRVTGVFLNDREFYIGATSDQGAAGYQVVTPLRRADGSIVLVNRGFVPENRKTPGSRAAGEIAGEVTVTGPLRVAKGRPNMFVPDKPVGVNYWFYVDIPSMAAEGGLDHVLPFYVDADATPNPGGYPVGGQTQLSIPNNHLQYAITWYGLAATLVGVYIAFVRRHRREQAEA